MQDLTNFADYLVFRVTAAAIGLWARGSIEQNRFRFFGEEHAYVHFSGYFAAAIFQPIKFRIVNVDERSTRINGMKTHRRVLIPITKAFLQAGNCAR